MEPQVVEYAPSRTISPALVGEYPNLKGGNCATFGRIARPSMV
jgi:hypothetical protein